MAYLFFLIFTLTLPVFSEKNCVVRRAFVDNGSGSTKLVVADFNTCTQTIENILGKDVFKLKLQKAISEKGGGATLPYKTQREGVGYMKHAACLAVNKYKAQELAAVATAWARVANNTYGYLDKIEDTTGLFIRKIPQSKEGIYGYLSAIHDKKIPYSDNFVMWDIGGGSMQFVTDLDPEKLLQQSVRTILNNYHPVTYGQNNKEKVLSINGGKIAAATFNKAFKDFMRGKKTTDIYPLSKKHIKKGIALAQEFAKKQLPDSFRNQLKGKNFVGIGGLHKFTILKRIEKVLNIKNTDQNGREFYQKSQIRAVLKKLVNKTAKEVSEITGEKKYLNELMTNLMLVHGYMDILEIETVYFADVNSGMGAFYDKSIWEGGAHDLSEAVEFFKGKDCNQFLNIH